MSRSPSRTRKIPTHLRRDVLAKLLDIAPETLSRLVTRGVLVREEAGFPVAANVQRYIAHTIDVSNRRAAGTESSQNLAEARCELIRRRLEREEKGLVDMNEAIETISDIAVMMAEAFDRLTNDAGLPPKVAATLIDEKQQFQTRASRILERLATGKEE